MTIEGFDPIIEEPNEEVLEEQSPNTSISYNEIYSKKNNQNEESIDREESSGIPGFIPDEEYNESFSKITQEIKNEIDDLVEPSISYEELYRRRLLSQQTENTPTEDNTIKPQLSSLGRTAITTLLAMEKGIDNGWSGMMTPLYWVYEHSPLALLTDEESEGYQKLKNEMTRSRLSSSGSLPPTDENLIKYRNGELTADDIQLPNNFGSQLAYTIADLIPSTAATMGIGGLTAGAAKTAGAANVAAKATKATGVLSKLKPSKTAVAFASLNAPKTYRDVYDSELDLAISRGISAEKAKGIATANAILQTPVEYLGDLITGGIIKGAGATKNFIRKLFTDGVIETTEKGGIKVLSKQGLLNSLKEISKDAGKTFLSEGIEEGAQQLISNVVTNVSTGKKVTGWTEDVWESARVGGGIGAIFGGGMNITQRASIKWGFKKEKQELKSQWEAKLKEEQRIRNEQLKEEQRIRNEQLKEQQLKEQEQQKLKEQEQRKDQIVTTLKSQDEYIDNYSKEYRDNYKKSLDNNIKVFYDGKEYSLENFSNLKLEKNKNKKITVNFSMLDETTGKRVSSSYTDTHKNIVNQIKKEFYTADSMLESDLTPLLNNYELTDSNTKKTLSWNNTSDTSYTITDKSTGEVLLNKGTFEDVQMFKLKQFANNELNKDVYNKHKMYNNTTIDNSVNHVLDQVPNLKNTIDNINSKEFSKKENRIRFYKGTKEDSEFAKDSYFIGNNGIVITDKQSKETLQGRKHKITLNKSDIVTSDEVRQIINDIQRAYDNTKDPNQRKILGMFLPENGKLNFVILSRLTGKSVIEDMNNPGRYVYFGNKAEYSQAYSSKDNTVQESASEVLNDNDSESDGTEGGKVQASVNAPLKNPVVSNNQSQKEKSNIRRRANQSEKENSDNKGSGNAGEYGKVSGEGSDSRNDRVSAVNDEITPGKEYSDKEIKDYNDYRKEQLAENISDLSKSTAGLVSKNHVKQAMLNIAEKLKVYVDKLSDKEAKNFDATGIALTRERFVKIANSTDGIAAAHELAHIMYQDIINKYGTEQDIESIFNIMDDKELLQQLVGNYSFDTYSDAELPSEIFSEIFAQYLSNPSKLNSLRTTNENINNILNTIDNVVNELDIVSEVKQAQKISESYNNQSVYNKALANIIMDDLPYSKVNSAMNLTFKRAGKTVLRTVVNIKNKLINNLLDDFKPLEKKLYELYKLDPTVTNVEEKVQDTITKLRMLRGGSSGTLQEFCYGSGMTWDRIPISGLVSIKEVFDSLDKVINHIEKTISQEEINKLKSQYNTSEGSFNLKDMIKDKVYREFGLYLQSLNTIGENTGTQEFVNKLLKDNAISIEDSKSFYNLAKEITLLKQLGLINSSNTFNETSIQNKLDKLLTQEKFKSFYGDITVKDVKDLYDKHKKTITSDSFKDITSNDTGLDILDALVVYEHINNNLPYADIFARAAQNLYTIQDHVLNYAYRSSNTLRHLVNQIRRESGAFHIPLMRSFLNYETSKQGIMLNEEYMLAPRKGSDRPIINPFNAFIQEVGSWINQAHIYSSLETLVELQGMIGSANVLVEYASTEEVDKITSQINDIYADVAEVLDSPNKVNFPDKRKVRDLVKQLNEIPLSSQEKELLKNYFTEKIANTDTEISNVNNPNNIDLFSDSMQRAKLILDYIADIDLLSVAFVNNNKFLMKNDRYFTVLNEQGNKVTYKMTDEHLLDGIMRSSLMDINYPQQLKFVTKLFKYADFGVKSGYTTFNIGFMINNFFRDYTRGLFYSPHYDTNKGILHIIPQAADFTWTYVTTALQELVPGPMLGKLVGRMDESILNRLGISKATKISSQKDLYEISGVDFSSNRFRNFNNKITAYLERQGTVIRKTEFKLMCKKLGVTPDIFNANPEELSKLDGFTKNTLQKFGVTSSNIQNILTPEQFSKFNSVSDTKILSGLNLTEQQQQDIKSLFTADSVQDVLGENIISQMYRYLQEVNIDYTRGSAATKTADKFFLFLSPTLNAYYDSIKKPKRLAFKSLCMILLGAMARWWFLDDPESDPLNPNNLSDSKRVPLKMFKNSNFGVSLEAEDLIPFNIGRGLFNSSPLGIANYLFNTMKDEATGVVTRINPAAYGPALLFPKLRGGTPYKLGEWKELYSQTMKNKISKDVNAGIKESTHTAGIIVTSLWNNYVGKMFDSATITPIMAEEVINSVIGGSVSGGYKLASNLFDYIGMTFAGPVKYNQMLLTLNKYSPLKGAKDSNIILGDEVVNRLKNEYNNDSIMNKRNQIMYMNNNLSRYIKGSTNLTDDNPLYQQYLVTNTTSQMIDLYEQLLPLCTKESEIVSILIARNKLIETVNQYIQQEHPSQMTLQAAKHLMGRKKKLSENINKYNKAFREYIINREDL